MRGATLPLLLLLLASRTHALSKYDKDAQIREEQEKEQKTKKENSRSTQRPLKVHYAEKMQYRPRAMTKEQIVEQSGEAADGERRFPQLPALAYVTPWNNKGYTRAETLAHKLSHVSPVWLQVKPEEEGGEFRCRLLGTHDVDRGWIARLRERNPQLKIVPRVLFDGWPPLTLLDFVASQSMQQKCVKEVNDFLERSQLDGAVVEVWTSGLMAAASRPQEAHAILSQLAEALSDWGADLHRRGLLLVVPVPPPVTPEGKHVELHFGEHYWRVFGDNVDFVQVMTHDYKGGPEHFPNAPLDWVERNILVMVGEEGEHARRLLVGLNHYGLKTDWAERSQGTLMGDEYLKLLADPAAELLWDEKASEHYVKLGSTEVYFPSLSSLEMRTVLAAEYGTGISIWDLGQGLEYFGRML